MFKRYVYSLGGENNLEMVTFALTGKFFGFNQILGLRFFYQFVWLVLKKFDQTGVLDCVLDTCIRVQIDRTIYRLRINFSVYELCTT